MRFVTVYVHREHPTEHAIFDLALANAEVGNYADYDVAAIFKAPSGARLEVDEDRGRMVLVLGDARLTAQDVLYGVGHDMEVVFRRL